MMTHHHKSGCLGITNHKIKFTNIFSVDNVYSQCEPHVMMILFKGGKYNNDYLIPCNGGKKLYLLR